MPEEQTPKSATQIEFLDARRMPVRVGLAAAILFALVFGWFAARWQLGNMLADLTGATDPNAKEIAALAVSFAPADPAANWLFVSAKKDDFAAGSSFETAKSFETVNRLAPFDYRWWVQLGRMREQAEEFDAAETAYRRALELAPSYVYPRWQTGNFYLRRNQGDKAFAELKQVADGNTIYRDQVFSLAWDFYNKDTARLEQIAGDAVPTRAALAKFYASKERADDALRVWNSLSDEERQANTPTAKVIAQAFYEKKIFRQALEFARSLGIEPDAKPETIQNGGFEKPIGKAEETYFGWKNLPIEKIDVKLDPVQRREGARSLRISFNGFSEPTLFDVYQYVVVEPSARYRLTFWARTENLKSGGTPEIEVANAGDGQSIATADAFPAGTNDWKEYKLEFATPPNAQAVSVHTTRAFCGNGCPIFGTIWYDDFKLERLK